MDPALSPEALGRIARQDYDFNIADATERVKIQWSIADAFLKALVLTNGGAMVALFTLVGNLTKGPAPIRADPGALWPAFGAFVGGLTLALFAHFAAFMSQHYFLHASMFGAWRAQEAAERKVVTRPAPTELAKINKGNLHYVIGLVIALASLICFAVGCGFALKGFIAR